MRKKTVPKKKLKSEIDGEKKKDLKKREEKQRKLELNFSKKNLIKETVSI